MHFSLCKTPNLAQIFKNLHKTVLFLIIFLDTAYFEFVILGDVFSIILQNFTKIEDNDTLFLIFKLNYLKSYNVVL